MRAIAGTLIAESANGKFNLERRREGSDPWVSGRFMTASSSAASRPTKRLPAGSSFPIRRRKSRRRAKSSPLAPAPSEDGKITPLDVKAGDKILFGKWSGTEVKIDGEDLIIMKESDILGIVG